MKITWQLLKKGIKRNAPTLLMGCAGALSTSSIALAWHIRPKVDKALEEAKKNKAAEKVYPLLLQEYAERYEFTLEELEADDDYVQCLMNNAYDATDLTFFEKSKVVIKTAWPLGITYIASMACGYLANHKHLEKNAMLYSVYKITEKARDEYRDELLKKDGGELIDQKVRRSLAEKSVMEDPPTEKNTRIVNPNGTQWFRDKDTGQYIRENTENLRAKVNELNAKINRGDRISKNDRLRRLGFVETGTKEGDYRGWWIPQEDEADYDPMDKRNRLIPWELNYVKACDLILPEFVKNSVVSPEEAIGVLSTDTNPPRYFPDY